MNKLFLSLTICMCISINISCQNNPVKWDITSTNSSDNSYEINLQAEIEKDWYIYGLNIEEGGPLPLVITFENADQNLISYTIDETSLPTTTYDEIFEMNVASHSGKTNFTCTFTPKSNITDLNLIIDGQACNKKDGSCSQIYTSIPIKLN